MNLKIINKEQQQALPYTILKGSVAFDDKTPSRKEVTAEIAKQMNVKESFVGIRSINPVYGFRNAQVEAIVYKDENAKNALEPEYIRKRLERKKKEEKPAKKPE